MKIPTVTIGIPAFNEEKNIINLLSSLLKQKEKGFKLDRIIVYSDGSTDLTNIMVSDFAKKNKKIKFIKSQKRSGKNKILNYFYSSLKSDIFVSFDADIEIKDSSLISKIVKNFKDTKVGLVGGRVIHKADNNIFGSMQKAQEYFWNKVYMNIDLGNNIHSHTGPISAGSREFLLKVKIPSNVPDDHYLYMRAYDLSFKYRFANDAKVFITLPKNYKDYFAQRTRFINSADSLRRHFKDFEKHYEISKADKLLAYWRTFKKFPLILPLSLGLVAVQRMVARFYESRDSTWIQIATSK